MNRRMPAEWERQERILMAFPHEDTDWADEMEEARGQFAEIIKILTRHGVRVLLICDSRERTLPYLQDCDMSNLQVEECNINDTWTRDYGPITVEEDGKRLELDFGFNGWGLKFAADKDNLVNLDLSNRGILEKDRYRNNRDFTLEGGSIESDGKGTILTTSQCLCSPNRNGGKSKAELEAILRERLGAERVLWLDHGFMAGDDTDSHIDTLARLAPDDQILYVETPAEDDVHHLELKAMQRQLEDLRTAEGKPYKLMALPFPDAIYAQGGERLPATYANYLVANGKVFMPTYGQPEKDRRAMETAREAFKGYEVIGVDCRHLIKQHGSLHCSTMQL